MRLSALNIFKTHASRKAEQDKEVIENSNHPKTVWDMREHKGWSNSISFFNWETRRLVGHTTPLPCVGDEFLAPMFSGKTGKFILISVEYCHDPSDMWFGIVKDVGYVE